MSLDEPNRDPYERLRNLRPTPTAYAAFGTAADLSKLVNTASQRKLMTRNSRWNLFVEDFASPDLNIGASEVDIIIASMLASDCCKLQGRPVYSFEYLKTTIVVASVFDELFFKNNIE